MKLKNIIPKSEPVPNGFKLGRTLMSVNGADVIYMTDPYEEYIVRYYLNGIYQPERDFVTDDFNEVEDILRK